MGAGLLLRDAGLLPAAVAAPRADPAAATTRSLTVQWLSPRSDGAPVDQYEVDVRAWGSDVWQVVRCRAALRLGCGGADSPALTSHARLCVFDAGGGRLYRRPQRSRRA